LAAKRIIIDTDPGIDDALAILLACASPELAVLALTTVAGNVRLELTTANALRLLELAGRPEIPVYPGCDAPLQRMLVTGQVHGATGLDGAELPAPKQRAEPRHGVDYLIETLSAAEPASVTLAAIGPLSNVAAALQRAPAIERALAGLVVMGGATPGIGGNMSPHAEFNILVDPEAAALVFSKRLPITLVPLDLSHKICASPERVRRIAEIGGPVGRTVSGMLRHYCESEPFMHDPLTIAWLLRPELFSGRRAFVHVETLGISDGETVFDWHKDGNCLVLLDGEEDGFFELLIARLARLQGDRELV
jgi:purine nucleosidase